MPGRTPAAAAGALISPMRLPDPSAGASAAGVPTRRTPRSAAGTGGAKRGMWTPISMRGREASNRCSRIHPKRTRVRPQVLDQGVGGWPPWGQKSRRRGRPASPSDGRRSLPLPVPPLAHTAPANRPSPPCWRNRLSPAVDAGPAGGGDAPAMGSLLGGRAGEAARARLDVGRDLAEDVLELLWGRSLLELGRIAGDGQERLSWRHRGTLGALRLGPAFRSLYVVLRPVARGALVRRHRRRGGAP